METFGTPDKFQFKIDWATSENDSTSNPTEITRGGLSVVINHITIWGGRDETGIDWTWIELLDHLSLNWRYLLYEEEVDLVGQTNIYEEYKDSHNLASGLNGIQLPDLIISRSGNRAEIKTSFDSWNLPWEDVISVLRSFGDSIVKRIKNFREHPKVIESKHDWKNKRTIKKIDAASIYTGIPNDKLRELFPDHATNSTREFKPDCILAAARFVKDKILETEAKSLYEIVSRAMGRAKPFNQKMANLSDESQVFLNEMSVSYKPWEQGRVLAGFIRKKILGSDSNLQPIHMESVFKDHSIHLIKNNFKTDNIDAIAIWPDTVNVAVIINTKGFHSHSLNGKNATLAHEFCHLLIDRSGALPLCDVAGGRVPKYLEKRARAFAAELLLPEEALQMLCSEITVKKLDEFITKLSKKFNASRMLVTNQLWHRFPSYIDADVRIAIGKKMQRYHLRSDY